LWNRWGQPVWEATGEDIHWNGRHTNGEALPDGVYYYELLRTGREGTTVFTGYIHVLHGR
ncbi:MAG TPA: gliding motility-associated C-terminal domain-containing protein, partial [Flavobacteriales bacterium]|nr:gliding motility-associated C-terminal domain-containing protein [Flavobacteriales bacterium]